MIERTGSTVAVGAMVAAQTTIFSATGLATNSLSKTMAAFLRPAVAGTVIVVAATAGAKPELCTQE